METDISLYDTDYDIWLEQQITALRSRKWEGLDIPHLLEELEVLNKSNKRELSSYLVVLLAHLLKWQYQPLMRCGSWEGSIGNSRRRIHRLFKDQPSLKAHVPLLMQEAYEDAKKWAHEETKISANLFPESCPYTAAQVLDAKFLPD